MLVGAVWQILHITYCDYYYMHVSQVRALTQQGTAVFQALVWADVIAPSADLLLLQ